VLGQLRRFCIAAAVLATALVAFPATAQAGSGIPVVTIGVTGDQATVSQSTMRPGVVEFRVASTFTVPGPQGGPDMLTVVRTDQLDAMLAQLPSAFSADPGDPASLAAAAQAMATIRGLATFYGGGFTGTTWQVDLPVGTYTVLGGQSTVMGLAKVATFSVAGEPRMASMHQTAGTIRAITVPGGSAWVSRGLPRLGDGWLRFANSSQELHFLDMSGVRPGTTRAQVKRALLTSGQPKFFTGVSYVSDVISPGVSIALKGPFAPGEYLVTCFIPSEADGMPHALMGMWKLVDIG
jgi:hypothetical protein